MKATNNNRDRRENRTTKWVIGALVIAVILLILLLRSCSAGSNEYHMVLNGDNPFEIMLNEQYHDPGVTFVDENNHAVSSQKQSELEEEMTITGLDQVDTSVSGEYQITYQYEDQSLERLVKVLEGEQDNKPGDTKEDEEKPGSNDDNSTVSGNDVSGTPSNTDNPSTSDNPEDKNPITTPVPGGNDDDNDRTPVKPAFKLPDNVTFMNRTVVYDGNEHSVTVNNLPYGIKAIYYNNTGTNAGRYDSRVVYVLSDFMKTVYSSVEPSSMTATLTIKQATPSYTVPTGLTAKVGQTLADVKLPKGFAFESSLTTSVGPVGYNSFLVTYTPDDTVNYKTVSHIEVIIKVTDPSGGGDDEKEVFNLPSNVTFSNRTVTYNGQTYTIRVANVPSGIEVRYVNNSGKDAGTYNATAYFSIGDELKDKCSSVNPSSMSATLIIKKATPSYTVPSGLTAKVGQTLANVKLPKGFTFVDPLTTSVGTVGSHVFKVTYTPDDTKNFEIVSGIDVIIDVTDGSGPIPDKPLYELPDNVRFNNRTETYDGTAYSITAENVPEGIIATYSNATRTNAGSQTATVAFSLSESLADQYSGVKPSSMTATLTINPAIPSYTVPTGLNAVEGQTLDDVKGQLGKGFSFEDPLTTSVGAPGNNEFTVTYTPDSSNYKVVKGIKVTIHVTNKPNPDKPKFNMPVNVAFNDLTQTYTGTEYSITAINVPVELSVSYSNNTRTDAGSQTATATFRLSDKGLENYSGINGTTVMTATLTINPADPTYTVPTGLNAVEGQTLDDVKGQLGKGFSFEDPLTTSVGAPGDNEFTVTYTPDSSNYKVVKGIKVTIHVTNQPDPTKPKFNMPANVAFNDLTQTYTGTAYSITAVNVPAELSVSYSNNTRTDAGSQTATATFRLSDKGLESYSGINGTTVMTATLTIDPADPTYTVPTGIEAVEGQTLADIVGQLGANFSFEDPLSTSVGDVGDNEFDVTYTPTSSNYKTVTGIKVTITVKLALITYTLPSNVEFPAVEGTYGEKDVFEATVINLPDHIVATVYTNNTRSDAGSQKARVEFSIKPDWAHIYKDVSPSYMETDITIHHALPSYTTPTGLTAKVGQTLGDVASQLGSRFEFEDPLTTSVGGEGDNNFTVKYTPEDSNYKVVTGILVTIHVSNDDPGIDKTALNAEIAKAEAIVESDWTTASYSAFASAYATAKDMPEGTQQAVDEKTAAIAAALALLKKDDSGADIKDPVTSTAALTEAKNKAAAVVESDYTSESYSKFVDAYAAVKDLPETTQTEVDDKTTAILDALSVLIPIGGGSEVKDPVTSTTELDELILYIDEELVESDYTTQSYSDFLSAYNNAIGMPVNTQTQVNQKVAAIRAALSKLVSIDDSSDDSEILDTSSNSAINMLTIEEVTEESEEGQNEDAGTKESEEGQNEDAGTKESEEGQNEDAGTKKSEEGQNGDAGTKESEEGQNGDAGTDEGTEKDGDGSTEESRKEDVPASLPAEKIVESQPAQSKKEDVYVETVDTSEKDDEEEEPDDKGGEDNKQDNAGEGESTENGDGENAQ